MIYLIRHGQASFLKSDYDKLSELGITQSKVVGEALKSRNAAVAFAARGALKRHEETAHHCLESYGQSVKSEIDERWNEYSHMELLTKHNPAFADFNAIGEHVQKQDKPMMALQVLLNDSISDWISNKHDYSISWEAFNEGIWTALNDVASQLSKGENAFVFTSGGPIAAVLIKVLSLQDEQFIDLQGRLINSSITKILVGKKGLSLSTYNEYSHLEHNPDLITYR